MASVAFPLDARSLTFDIGSGQTTCGYVYKRAQDHQPTFLLLHGFPSSSYDWRHQIADLSNAGYGVLVPDLLGYGDTDKPEAVEAYTMDKMSPHLAQILDHENLNVVIGVAHDWGVRVLMGLWHRYSERLSGLVVLNAPYYRPSPIFDIEKIDAATTELFGYSISGYWHFFNEEDAAETSNLHHESLTSLFYPLNNKTWITDLAPYEAAKSWISSGRKTALPDWISGEESQMHEKVMMLGGYQGPLNWYKALMRGMHAAIDAKISPERAIIDKPTLFIASDEDYISRKENIFALVQEGTKKGILLDAHIKELKGCGHWVQLQRADDVSKELVAFAKRVAATF